MTDVNDRSPTDFALLGRYLAGKATLAEAQEVAEWVAAHPDRAEQLESLGQVAGLVRVHRPQDDVEARVVRINAALDASESPKFHSPAPVGSARVARRIAWPRSWIYGVGALALFAAAALGVGGRVSQWIWGKALYDGRTYATASGETLNLVLADGTHVTLAPSSQLRLDDRYGEGSRQVALEGEAYFAVVHDFAHPFTVRTHEAVTRDVGTAFDVRAYREELVTRIVVAEGAVAVSDRTLHVGDVAEIGPSAIGVVEHHDDLSAYTAWRQGGLVFNKTALREVVRDIARTYGVTIVVADSTLMDKRITSSLSGQPLTLVLDVITRTIGARYEQRAGKIIIRNGLSANHPHEASAPPVLLTARVREGQE